MVSKKALWIIAGCAGLLLLGTMANKYGTTQPPAAVAPVEAVDSKYGPKPNIPAMTFAYQKRLRASLHDPDSLEGPDLSAPAKDTITVKGKKVDCWRVDLQFRSKNGFGAMRLTTGTVWMKNGESIQESM